MAKSSLLSRFLGGNEESAPVPVLQDRNAWLRQGLSSDRPGIEFGPLDRPIMPRASGEVRYIDHLDQAGLQAKYREHAAVDCAAIPHIDYVVGPGSTFRREMGSQRAAYAIASHVIEHVPDLVGWLEDIHAVLEDGGVLALAIPDLRRCFDALRRESTAGEVVGAHLAGDTRPSSSRIFDAMVNEVSWNGQISWHVDPPPGELVRSRSAAQALAITRRVLASGDYMDVHCWTFTPGSFRALGAELVAAGLIRFRWLESTDTRGHEFLVRLQRDDTASDADILHSWRGAASPSSADGLPTDFNAVDYLRRNPDVAAAGLDAAEHYLNFGRAEGRALR